MSRNSSIRSAINKETRNESFYYHRAIRSKKKGIFDEIQ